MVPSAAYSPSTGFHSVNTSGGSPAAISDSSLASPVALGMLDSVTWISGWVALNLFTIWLSSVKVLPDHMVCQVMSTTPVDEELPLVDAAVMLGMAEVHDADLELTEVGREFATADIDPDHPEAASVEVTISTASVRTNNGIRDNDLRSSNFLEVEKYPVIKFKSTSVEPAGTDHFKLTGDLTIKETTHPVVLDVTKYGEFNDPSMMGHRIAYGATTKINRRDFGLSFSMVLDGRLVVSEDIQITIEGELVEQKETADARTAGS